MTAANAEREIDREGGRYRSVVTYLEMRGRPAAPPPAPPRDDVRLERWRAPGLEDYLELFHRIGDRWLWHGRLTLDPEDIRRLVRAPGYELWRLWTGADVAGLCELDRSRPGEVKVVYFGLVPERIGTGLGGYFLRSMLAEAWRGAVDRVWLHTCSEDHPDAPTIYQRVGFRPYHQEVEWVPDPRLRGLVPRNAGPHVPLAE